MNDPVPLTILITCHNTADFLKVSLPAIKALTESPHRILINDDGSDERNLALLRGFEKEYPNVKVFYRKCDEAPSYAHAVALDFLITQSDSPYTAILDSDCMPLLKGWDQYLISRLNSKIRMIGSTRGEAWSGKKPVDFPAQFLILMATDTYKSLGITNYPRDISAGEDTCWEWKPKYTQAGYSAECLRSENTRFFKDGPFRNLRCAEYYTHDGRLIGSHFGRGTNPRGKFPLKNRILNGISYRLHWSALHWYWQRWVWLNICKKLVRESARGSV
jgi:glycosyltransferase involved in cell wall biosynthesis